MNKRLVITSTVLLLLIMAAVSALAVGPLVPELKDPVVLNNLAYSMYENGDYALAEAVFERALQIDPDYVLARENLAIVLNTQEEYAEAAEQLSKLVAIDVDNAQYWYDLGVNKIALFRYETGSSADFYDGLSAYKRAASIDPGYAHVQDNLAALQRVGEEFGLL